MRFPVLLFIATGLILTLHSPAAPEPVPAVETVALTDWDEIHWEGRKKQALDALKFKNDASIRLENCADIEITACDFHSLELVNCQRITIRNCWIHDSARIGIQISNSHEISIQGCRLEKVMSGVYAVDSQAVQFIGNFSRNVLGPFPRGQMIQFDHVTGLGSVIRGNYAINDQDHSHPEDVINLYKSEGTAGSPIIIEGNYLVGDPKTGSEGKSATGSGIMLGDCGGAYLTCRHNVVLSAGQVGIGVAGGRFIRAEDNVIFGSKSSVSNVGLYVWNQSKLPSDHIVIARNRVSWTAASGEDNAWWDGGGADKVDQSGNRFADATLASNLPPPPSQAPNPPKPWASANAKGVNVVRVPWKQN